MQLVKRIPAGTDSIPYSINNHINKFQYVKNINRLMANLITCFLSGNHTEGPFPGSLLCEK